MHTSNRIWNSGSVVLRGKVGSSKTFSIRAAWLPHLLNSTALLQAPIPWTTGILERETGFEPATSTLARLHSTTELFPLPLVLSEWILTKPKIGVKRF